ncbi:MAG: DUF2437 domain-containing protein [Planctomycetaceae bacterium]|nr:DUF2437 domain-containing protein [Planctomycetaceae bacterium]
MRIARIQLDDGSVCLARETDDGKLKRLDGDLFGPLSETGDVMTGKRLSPLAPVDILCIGLNYR